MKTIEQATNYWNCAWVGPIFLRNCELIRFPEQEKLFVCHPKNSISPRALHSASTTSSGCLLVCGGKNSASCVQDSAIYDPSMYFAEY